MKFSRTVYKQYGAILALASTGLIACSNGDGGDSVSTAPSGPVQSANTFAERCSALAGSLVQGGAVGFTEYATAKTDTVAERSMPDHCLVRGAMNERIGADGKSYKLQFELRLPQAWNNRFYYQGGSGVDGTLFTAYGTYPGGGNTRNALLDGFAVVTTDSGHLTETGTPNGMFLFGADPQARMEYGHTQLPQVSAAAKLLIEKYYGQKPEKSYFVGCSNGGRQAMAAAQRYPELFDGIVAAAPGFRLAEAAVQGSVYQAQILQAISPLGENGRPDFSKAFTAEEKAIVKSKILASCDGLDGIADGMVFRMSACKPDPVEWACKPGESSNCLPAAKADYLSKFFTGAKTRTGEQIYAPWPFDPGMAKSAFANPFQSIFAGELSHIYTTPPTITADLAGYALTADVDTEFSKISTTSGIYTVSGKDFTNADSPDIDRFKARGGKLIMFNGGADLAFSNHDLASYYRKLVARYGVADAGQTARAFMVPGMEHCSGGSDSVDQFDAFGAVKKWAEEGVAPDQIIATARASAGVAWPGRTRPLCAYPKEAVYKGSGNPEDAANFVCQ